MPPGASAGRDCNVVTGAQGPETEDTTTAASPEPLRLSVPEQQPNRCTYRMEGDGLQCVRRVHAGRGHIYVAQEYGDLEEEWVH